MDAFYASVEQRDFPELKGKPVVVGRPEQRGVIAAASYEARKYGIHSAMPSVAAMRKCPDLIFQPHRFDVYTSISRQIREIFHEYTDLVEPLSLDEAYLDVTFNRKEIQSAMQIAMEIKKRIQEETGLTASAGVSYNKFLAKIASDMRKPDGLFLIKPNQAFDFLSKLNINKFHGIGKVTEERLAKKNIKTGKDLQALNKMEMKALFGKSGDFFYNIVRGVDEREVNADRIRKSISVENTYLEDLKTRFAIITELYRLEKRLLADIEESGKSAKTVTLKVRFNDFKTLTRSKSVPNPISSFEEIQKISRILLNEIDLEGKGIRLLGLGVSNLFDERDLQNRQLEIEF